MGHAGPLPCDPASYLKVRKNRKMMGPQDDLAVVAAGRALEAAGLGPSLGERAGLYAAVGYIPFEEAEIETLLAGSLRGGDFSMERFSTDGYNAVPPLLTFRCLSNMPAFHVSVNFDLQGPYAVFYPGAGQFYLALGEARAALAEGRVDVALVLGVAHQENFLVRHQFGRQEPPVTRLSDAAGCLVLERAGRPGGRVRGRLLELGLSYQPTDPFEDSLESVEAGADASMGPASLPVALATAAPGRLCHELRTRDGFIARSVWSLGP